MKTSQRALVCLFVLILVHFIICSIVVITGETRSNCPPRKLLARASSCSTSIEKLKIEYAATQRPVATSLRKNPPSNSNPTHNNLPAGCCIAAALDIVFGKGVVGKQGFVDIVWNQGLAPRSSEKLLSKSTPIGFNVLYIDAGPNAYQFSCRLISRSANS